MTATEIRAALETALALAADGRKCFPCARNKRPATPRGFHDAVSDPVGLHALWRQYPAPLVGVATGAISGIDVLDFDRKHPEAAAWWSRNRDNLPQTRAHRTRSGGLHLFFRHQPGMRCWAARPVPGIDGRCDGGFVIWWPALGLPVLCETLPAVWPAWLLADLQPSPPLVRARSRATIPDDYALARLVRKVASAAHGQRNAVTFWAACRAGEMAASGLIGANTAADIIVNAALCSGLPSAEARRTAWSGVCTGLRGVTRIRNAARPK
jgi:hypothetical protein